MLARRLRRALPIVSRTPGIPRMFNTRSFMAPGRRGPTPTSIILVFMNMASLRRAKATSTTSRAVSCDARREKRYEMTNKDEIAQLKHELAELKTAITPASAGDAQAAAVWRDEMRAGAERRASSAIS